MGRDLEELAPTIRTDVERQQARCAQPPSGPLHHLQACANSVELLVEQRSIHGEEDTGVVERFGGNTCSSPYKCELRMS